MLVINLILVIWKTLEYNIGDGINPNTGKFTAPIDGIYFFYSHGRTFGGGQAWIQFFVNGSAKAYSRRDEQGDYDTVTLSAQFQLTKSDTVSVRFYGSFYYPHDAKNAYFEGHLIRQIN